MIVPAFSSFAWSLLIGIYLTRPIIPELGFVLVAVFFPRLTLFRTYDAIITFTSFTANILALFSSYCSSRIEPLKVVWLATLAISTFDRYSLRSRFALLRIKQSAS